MEQKVPKVQVSHLTKKFGSLLVLDNIPSRWTMENFSVL